MALEMILSIDFGGAVAKVLIVRGSGFEVVEVPLGFRTRPRLTITETLRYIIKRAVGDKKLDAIYASGEIASVELREILTEPPLDPITALEKLKLPIVVVGAGITCINGAAVRGVEIEDYAEDIARWLPFEVKISEIQNYFANKKLYPQIIPTTKREIRLEQAAARVRVKSLIVNRKSSIDGENYIIASGGVFSKAPRPSYAILTLLDALQPHGLLNILLDQKQMLPALATLAFYNEAEAQKILDQDPFTFLGTTFSIPEDVFLQIDVGLAEPQELQIDSGELVVFPLDRGKVVKVRFKTKSQKGEFEAEGGPAGLIIDARGRPLELPKSESERRRVLTEWEEASCSAPLFKK